MGFNDDVISGQNFVIFHRGRPVSKKLVRDLFDDRAQILRDRVSKIKFQAVLNTDHYKDLANKRTDGPEIPRTH